MLDARRMAFIVTAKNYACREHSKQALAEVSASRQQENDKHFFTGISA
jgi:hypothetical protein